MNLGLTSHHQQSHMGIGPQFKVSPERPEKLRTTLAIPGKLRLETIAFQMLWQRTVTVGL